MQTSYELTNKPHIDFKHIDGPMLWCRDGTCHFLTSLERIQLKLGMTTIEKLEEIYMNTEPQRG